MYTVLDDGAEAFFRNGSLRTWIRALRNFQSVLVDRAPTAGALADFPRYGALCEVLSDLHRRLSSPETDTVLQVLGEGLGATGAVSYNKHTWPNVGSACRGKPNCTTVCST